MARRNEHSRDEIRDLVLDAAVTIISNEGYSALTVRKIAKEMGYTVGSIYMVFASMADLILQIKENTINDLARQLQQTSSGVPEQYIAGLAKTYLQFAVQHFNCWSLIFQPTNEIPEAYQQKINQLFSIVEARFSQLAPNCSEQQCKQAAKALWSGVHGICVLSLTGKQNAEGINDVENSLLLLVESFISGWLNLIVEAPSTSRLVAT